MDEPLFTAEQDTLHFAVYADRIEATVKKRVQTVPLAEVAEVMTDRRPKRLLVKTHAGKQYQYLLGGEIDAARQAILARLSALARG